MGRVGGQAYAETYCSTIYKNEIKTIPKLMIKVFVMDRRQGSLDMLSTVDRQNGVEEIMDTENALNSNACCGCYL